MVKAKDKSDKKSSKKTSELLETIEPVVEEKVDLRNIKILIEKIEHIEPAFTATDIYVGVKHSDIFIGESEKVVVHDKENVLLNHEIESHYNIASELTLDNLLSCPLYFTAWQVPGESDITLYPSRSETTDDSESPVITRGSITSLYEAILGMKFEEEELDEDVKKQKVKIKDKGKKEKKGKSKEKVNDSKASKDSKSTKDSKGSKKEVTIDPDAAAPVCIGSCNIDLQPFFLGETEITNRIPLHQEKIHLDDEIITSSNLSQLTVKITIDKPIFSDDGDRKLTNLLNITVESIYSLPEFFNEELDYKISTLLPAEDLTLKPICIENGIYKEGMNLTEEFKIWPNLATINNFSSYTPYKIDEDIRKIKNKIGASLNPEILKSTPRVTWNILKKCWLTENGTELLQKFIIRYRRWPIEIWLSPKENVGGAAKKPGSKDSKQSKSSGTGSTGSKKTNASKGSKVAAFNPELQHLMGFVDISSILYPGVTKTRVACELRTFQQNELTKETGYDNSYFEPKKPPVDVPEVKEDKGGKAAAKDKKGGKGKDDSSKKNAKGKDKKGSQKSSDKGSKVPEPEPEPEPSVQIFNENGEPTFIVLEFELMNPFKLRRTLEDLTPELHLVIPNRNIKPCILTVRFATKYYRETVIKLAAEINVQYQGFTTKYKDAQLICFIKYLQQSGLYQTYCTTFTRAVLMLVKEKFNYNNDFKVPSTYINYVSNVYIYLQNILNTQIHELMSCQMIECGPLMPTEVHYLYMVSEALEHNALLLAERYHLQELNQNITNPDTWLNYAVFNLQIHCSDKAFECLKEALALQLDHKYGLLLFGLLLFERHDYYLCESTLLSLISYHPRFMDGWVCLYLYYTKRQHYEGCDFCLDMITQYHNDDVERGVTDESSTDYIHNWKGLAWTTSICNSKSVFYQTALTLIKLQALDFADLALSTDNFTQDGVYKYYQAVILYFRKDYLHALMHLADAQKLHGPDYAVNSLIGHCHYHLENYQDAKEAYEFIVEAYNRPDDMHMLYMNLACIYETEKNLTLARKYMFYVCKYSATPYSWLMLGILFYRANNYVNAEACLEESNIHDIRLPETWAYLVLVNIKYGKNWEAQQCYTQMKRFNLKNEALLDEVDNEMRKIQRFL